MALDRRIFWKNERIAFLALTTLKGVGFWTLHNLAESGFGFKNTFKQNLDKYIKLEPESNSSDPEIKKKLWQRGVKIIQGLEDDNIVLIFKGEERYPKKLKETPDAPEWIFVQGNIENLRIPSIGIVGTRKPSEDGIFLTRLVLTSLSKSSYATVSGLALGIDQLAHVESIKYGLPTIAVLGTGIRENYPKGSERLRKMIIDNGGTIITEYLPLQSFSSENFVRRNRIQAALSEVLIPIEWKIKSGTAHTVGFANKYKKKIVNVYLPKTKESRPELAFSNQSYGALSFEMPLEVFDFLECISPGADKPDIDTAESNVQLGFNI